MCKRASGEFGSWGAEPRCFSGRLAVVLESGLDWRDICLK